MDSIDLIPASYREGLWRARATKLFVIAVASLLGLGASGFGVLLYLNRQVQADVRRLESQTAITAKQRAQIERLQAQEMGFEKQLNMLRGLRSGGAAERMFVTIDRALNGDDVWFLNWNFRRAGVLVEESPAAVNKGYFIVVPSGAKKPQSAPWEVETHMTIKGQARDHAALSAFVRRLFAQPEIQDVRVLNTSLRRYTASSVVDFDLGVVMHSGGAS